MWGLTLVVIVLMVLVNGLFAGYEIALASISVGRLDLLTREGRRGAAAALRMKGNIEASLAVVQMGITLAGAIAAAVGGAGAEESVEPYLRRLGLGETATQALAIALVVAPLTAITIVFGELVPKVFSLRHKEWVCLTLSPAIEWFGYAVWPAVWLFESATNVIMSFGRRSTAEEQEAKEEAMLQELRAAASVARTGRLIGPREEGIIVGAAELPETPVREAMLPAEHISMLNLDDPLGESLVAAHNDMHTRFPVTERPGDPQGIVGYVNFKDIVACMRMSPDLPSVRGIVRPLPSFDADTPLSQVMESLIQGHTHIALVREKDGRVVGLITLEDILEEFVGDIRDEYDRLPAYVTPSGAAWVVGGGTSLRALASASRIALSGIEQNGSEPLHGWMERKLGRRVRGGDVVREEGIRVLARKVRRGMLLEALIGPDPTRKA
ncbi:MAG TPA: hemolysin family protein [Planctomycetaceae bacterium]